MNNKASPHKPADPERTTDGDIAKLKEMILGALDEAGGQAYLVRMANAQPAALWRCWAACCRQRWRAVPTRRFRPSAG